MNAWDNGVAPDFDIYSESNLIVAEGYSPRLWFAECIATRKSLVSHQRAVAYQIRYLKQNYVGNS